MRVICFGTFDCLHPGHHNYFKQARMFGEELIIIVARNENVKRNKGAYPLQGEKLRLTTIRRYIKENDYTDKVYLGDKKPGYLAIKRFRPDYICVGYDQQVDSEKLNSEIKRFRLFCKVKRLRAFHPEQYKSSIIKAKLFKQ